MKVTPLSKESQVGSCWPPISCESSDHPSVHFLGNHSHKEKKKAFPDKFEDLFIITLRLQTWLSPRPLESSILWWMIEHLLTKISRVGVWFLSLLITSPWRVSLESLGRSLHAVLFFKLWIILTYSQVLRATGWGLLRWRLGPAKVWSALGKWGLVNLRSLQNL